MFKIGLSLIFAFLAAFVIVLAGFLSEVRIGTIILRGMLGFVVAGLVGAMFITLFENNKEDGLAESRERDSEEEMSYIPSDDEEEQMQEPQDEESPGFEPLTAQGLEHVEPPER